MNYLYKIAALLIVIAAGFMTVPLCFILGTKLGLLQLADSDLDLYALKTHFMQGTYMTWLACAVFSPAYLFLKGNERFLFLWAPLVVPMGYGLYVLFSLFSS
ncbi:MAG: hypothetical protein WBK55_08830 [Alphaproteobacteria bacterium]